MRKIAFALALGTLVAFAPPASAEAGGVVFGSVWFDVNEDGIRQADEPPVAGYQLMLNDMYTGVTSTDENGNYRFENFPDRTSYRISWFGRGTWAFTKSGGDSDFDPNTGATADFTVQPGEQAGPFNAGLIKERVDTAVTAVRAPRKVRVGDEVEVKITFENTGNSPTPLSGIATFPAGMTPLWTDAPVPYIDGQKVYMSSYYQPDTNIGESVTYTVRARVDASVRGQIVAEANNPWDTDENNNVRKATVRT
ncbi:hypothetical protein Lesp02_53850 [Lentzea sp. NBRC 105346]|uniref:SdrD B-like domain-containing protein n=1 Tax=Lentzea sp. NBRC 105346 TaxID=3032205 RepID=UPI0024A507DB|nr:SdrD B-like domain-containing protein [Lentzea sp. NBRC 105346]GLZ33197.1 hypothetical protein Lesp02_53850 [Lentzea sp. NBRC 105346]